VRFLADIIGVPLGNQLGPFLPINLANGATQPPQHYAFLVDDDERSHQWQQN
jgi:hypothetical protein